MKTSRLKTFAIQLAVLIALLVFVEAIMWLTGNRPGVLEDSLYPVDEFVVEPAFQSDEYGISSFVSNSPIIPKEYILNAQGFRSKFNYTKEVIDSLRQESNKQVIFLIGDSYTQGCCDSPVDSSFSDLLAKNHEYHILNFGIGAVDLYQYQQIVRKYVPMLKPELVVIPFYLGNDISHYERTIAPHIPFCYVIRAYPWLNAQKPVEFIEKGEKPYFESAGEAYQFYLDHYTLWGKNATLLERLIRKSIIASKLYIPYMQKELEEKKFDFYKKYNKLSDDVANTVAPLKEIKKVCEENNTALLILGIPSPLDAIKQESLSEQYAKYFEKAKVTYAFPDISEYSIDDYDGPETRNHFLNSGHFKFYQFTESALNEYLN